MRANASARGAGRAPRLTPAAPCLLALWLCSCALATKPATTASAASISEPSNPTTTMAIASFPSGCIFEWNGEFLGTTPFLLTVDTNSGKKWLSEGARFHVLKCTAPNGSHDIRTWEAGTRVPEQILFRPLRGSYEIALPPPSNIPHIWKAKGEPPKQS
ncbi:MAG: hypothetical protein N2322_02665 [Terrimicrobiaceae bacterium]|nr:hypothetical protein [Terrimicrobiaceae bacterium]